MTKILISGYYGFGNFGDEAILSVITGILKKTDIEIEISVLSNNPKTTRERYGVNTVERNSPADIFSEIRKCDIFISGGGSLLQDVTGWKTIPYYLGQVLFAQLLGKKTVFFAQGIGPVKRKTYRFLIKYALKKADYISVRDNRSRDLLVDWGLKKDNINLTVDPVFALKKLFDKEDLIADKTSENQKDRSIIGVSVRPWKNNDYLEGLAKSLIKLSEDMEADIVIIPFHQEQDQAISQELAAIISKENNKNNFKGEIYFNRPDKPVDLINIYKRLDIFVGVRLHSLIYSAVCNIPFVGLEYDPKIRGFMEMMSLNSIISLNEFDKDKLYRITKSVWENKNQFEGILKHRSSSLERAAIANFAGIINLVKDTN
ncbi:MAG: polysaccharide pyruvyl transferase CsaB [Halanaerobiaceae bacterium]